jgi:hypothetical protein
VPPKNAAAETLCRRFRRRPALQLNELLGALGTRSRMTVFRQLKAVGYLCSYTHARRYYTLASIPQFDEHGLWFHQGVGFSRAGTLKETVVELVDGSDDGRTHSELAGLLRLRAHNTLLVLLREGRIGREPVGNVYLYVSVDAMRAAEQIGRRQESAPPAPVSTEVVIAVLVEVLQTCKTLAPPSQVAARLALRRMSVTVKQVEQVYAQHGLEAGKKTAAPGSRPSQRSER